MARKRFKGVHRLGDADLRKRLDPARPSHEIFPMRADLEDEARSLMPGDSKEATVAALGGKTSGKKLATYLSGYRTSGGSMTGLSTRSVDLPVISPGKIRRAAKAGIISPDWDALSNRRQKEAPRLLLCDRVAREPFSYLDDGPASMIRQTIHKAHRVVFDEAAADRVSEVSSQCYDIVVEHETFARQPWDPMWVEMPLGNAQTAADRHGYLFTDHSVYQFSATCDLKQAPLAGFVIYHLHQPEREWPVACGIQQDAASSAVLFLGIHASKIDADHRAAITAHHRWSWLPVIGADPSEPAPAFHGRNHLEALQGQLIHILATLLLLNRPGLVQYHTKPAGRTFINGKFRPYMSHSTLHFVLDPKPALHAMRDEQREIQERAPLRWHLVRDHYCHSKNWREYGAIGCIHTPVQTDENWIPAPELPPLECSHWICSQCEGRRWRREYPNGRGSAGVGFVQQDMTLVETRRA